MTRIGPGKPPLGIHLIPRLGRQDIMHVLDLVVPPDLLVHAFPPEGLERVVDVRERDPAALVEVREERLVGEIHVDGVGVHVC